MARTPRDRASFEAQLERQLSFLRRSAADFDRGTHDEAIRLATSLRVMLHDTLSSTSLLTHLGIKSSIHFVDTGLYRDRLDAALNAWVAETDPGKAVMAITPGEAGLVELGIGADGIPGWFAPLREQRFHQMSAWSKASIGPQLFDAWWNTPLVESSSLKQFSRSDLVKIMANQDGGAHVDANLDQDYHDLNFDYLGMQMEVGNDIPRRAMDENYQPPPVINNVAFASVRQVAYEFLLTMDRYLSPRIRPGLYALADPYNHLPLVTALHRPVPFPQSVMIGTSSVPSP